MSILEDWMNALAKPPDDSPLVKELDRWKQINESLERGDYISKIEIDPQNSPLAYMEQTLEAINEKLEIEHKLHIEDREDADRQKIVDRNRFIITTIIGVVAAVAAIVGTTVSIITYLS